MKRVFVLILTLALIIFGAGCSIAPNTESTATKTQPTPTVSETTFPRQEPTAAKSTSAQTKPTETKDISPQKKPTITESTQPQQKPTATKSILPTQEPAVSETTRPWPTIVVNTRPQQTTTVSEETFPEQEPTVTEEPTISEETLPEQETTVTEETLPEQEPTVAGDTLPTQEPTVALEPVPFQKIISSGGYFKTTYFSPMNSAAMIECLFHEPIRQNTGKSYPLIIYLHGKGETLSVSNWGNSKVFIDTLMKMENVADKFGAYTLVPVTPLGSNGWWEDWELQSLKCLIDRLVRSYNIDAKRIYVTGISMGGFTTCQLLKEMPPDTFAAAVPLSGAYTMNDPVAVHNTAFRIYHSAEDTVVNVSCSRNLYQQLVASGHPNVEYFESDYGGHISPLKTAYGDPYFYFWLFEQSLP